MCQFLIVWEVCEFEMFVCDCKIQSQYSFKLWPLEVLVALLMVNLFYSSYLGYNELTLKLFFTLTLVEFPS